jgi:outer membrane protein assembly factor BamB
LEQKGLDRLIWHTPTPHPATGTITLTEDLVLIGCGNSNYVFVAENPEGFVLALDRETGNLLWEVPVPDAVLGAIAVRGDTAICPVRNGEVVALDLRRSGEILWRQRINGNSPALAGPAFTGELVYAVSQDGYLVVLDAADGSQVERHYINAPGKPGELGLSVSSPFVVGGRVYVGSETGGVRCFAGTKGK